MLQLKFQELLYCAEQHNIIYWTRKQVEETPSNVQQDPNKIENSSQYKTLILLRILKYISLRPVYSV